MPKATKDKVGQAILLQAVPDGRRKRDRNEHVHNVLATASGSAGGAPQHGGTSAATAHAGTPGARPIMWGLSPADAGGTWAYR